MGPHSNTISLFVEGFIELKKSAFGGYAEEIDFVLGLSKGTAQNLLISLIELAPILSNSTQSVLKYFCNLILYSLSCKFIAVIKTCRIHYLNIYLGNGVMKTPKRRLILLLFKCLSVS